MYLTTNMDEQDAAPYFLWDDPIPIRALHERLRTASEPERLRLIGKIMREANDVEVWRFVSLGEVLRLWRMAPPGVDSMTETLSPLQRALVERFFARVKTFPAFQRRIVRRGSESVVVDLVRDPTAGQLPKEQRGPIRLDSLREILANKICALLGRSELRDLVDAFVLDRRGGLSVEDALPIRASLRGCSRRSGLETTRAFRRESLRPNCGPIWRISSLGSRIWPSRHRRGQARRRWPSRLAREGPGHEEQRLVPTRSPPLSRLCIPWTTLDLRPARPSTRWHRLARPRPRLVRRWCGFRRRRGCNSTPSGSSRLQCQSVRPSTVTFGAGVYFGR